MTITEDKTKSLLLDLLEESNGAYTFVFSKVSVRAKELKAKLTESNSIDDKERIEKELKEFLSILSHKDFHLLEDYYGDVIKRNDVILDKFR